MVERVQPEGSTLERHYLLYARSRHDGKRADAEGAGSGAGWCQCGDELPGGLRRRPYLLWIARGQYRAAWRVLPALGPRARIRYAAYPHVERPFPPDESDFTLTLAINGQPAPYTRCLFYPSVATLAGQPATAFPVGRSREGLPIGLQAVGPYLEDRTPIRFTAMLAGEIGGFQKPEGYDA